MKTMQSKICIIFSSFLLFSFFSIHASSPPSSAPQNPKTTPCSYTPYPSYCNSTLPNNRSTTIHESGISSIYHSLSTTNKFLTSVNHYLNLRFAFSKSTIRALQDCQFLATLTRDYLSSTILSIRNTTSLRSWEADYFHALLSATITHQQTCLDGLQEVSSATSVKDALLAPLTNASKSCSVSLALIMHGWGGYQNSGRWLREISSKNDLHAKQEGFTNVPPIRASVKASQIKVPTIPAGVNVSQMVFVNPKPGKGNFTTIRDAVAAAPNHTVASDGYFVIVVASGTYKEYVSIASNQNYIMMIGSGINKTIISGNRSVVGGWTTFNSATFAVVGQGFYAEKITFQNTAGAINMQAVAVRNGADMSTFNECSFEGYQDTLYAFSMRQFYKKCQIYGTIDFIFGNAAVVFQSCNIYPRLPLPGQFNTITAQGKTDINQNTGTSIQVCNITAAPDLAASNTTVQTFLGRPWKTYSTTVFMQSFMDSLIDPAGWAEWSGNTSLSTLYYAEFNNTGPGSNTTNRVTWPGYNVINATVARNFTVAQFIQGKSWLPATGIHFTIGLV